MTGLPGITLVLGGARSGKSRFAEALALSAGPALYLATAQAFDDEMTARIAIHRGRRDAGWTTVEEPLDLAGALTRHSTASRPILLDCLTLWISNLMMATRDIPHETGLLLDALKACASPVVLVANEVGLGIVPDNAAARAFRDHAGTLNQRVAAIADLVFFIAAGLPLTLKGTLPIGSIA